MRWLASLVVCVVSVILYTLYVPGTPGYDWRMRTEGAKIVLIEKSVMIVDSLGYDSVAFYRYLLRIIFGAGEHSAESNYEHVEFKNLAFDGVKVRLYRPQDSASDALHRGIVIYHGGGWTIGSIDDIDSESRRLSRELRAVVLSVGYRLAPEHKFPAPLDDCVTATKYFLRNAKSFGVNPHRIALKGLSAGGALAAGVSLTLRDEKFQPQPKLQVIVNALLQALSLDTPSYQYNADNAYQTKSAAAWFLGNYLFGNQEHYYKLLNGEHVSSAVSQNFISELVLNDILPQDDIKESYKLIPNTRTLNSDEFWNIYKNLFNNQYIFPLMAEDLSGLPKAHVYTCYTDVLRDDGMLYARRLRQAGNGVTEVNLYECHHLWNVFHEFDEHSSKLFDKLIQRIDIDL